MNCFRHIFDNRELSIELKLKNKLKKLEKLQTLKKLPSDQEITTKLNKNQGRNSDQTRQKPREK